MKNKIESMVDKIYLGMSENEIKTFDKFFIEYSGTTFKEYVGEYLERGINIEESAKKGYEAAQKLEESQKNLFKQLSSLYDSVKELKQNIQPKKIPRLY